MCSIVMSKVLVWCHGGCFGGGGANYDAPLRAAIEASGCAVHSVEFTKSYEQALVDISIVAAHYESQGHQVLMGGISSGGLLAHQVANQRHLPALLIAPVLAPHARHHTLNAAERALQLSFFGDMVKMRLAEEEAQKGPNNGRCIIYGKGDSRAPEVYFLAWAETSCETGISYHEMPLSHIELCKRPPLDIVIQWISTK